MVMFYSMIRKETRKGSENAGIRLLSFVDCTLLMKKFVTLSEELLDTANKCFFCLTCCVISERPPFSIEKTDLHTVHKTILISLQSFKNGNSFFNLKVNAHLRLGILIDDFHTNVQYYL